MSESFPHCKVFVLNPPPPPPVYKITVTVAPLQSDGELTESQREKHPELCIPGGEGGGGETRDGDKE